jgi:hypothetical protein
MEVCPECTSRLVHPIEWDLVDRKYWQVLLRCPECEWTDTGIYTQQEADAFDIKLDKGARQLSSALKRFTMAIMKDELAIFSRALEADQILPEDF